MLQGLGSEERPMYRHCTTAQYKKKPVVLHVVLLYLLVTTKFQGPICCTLGKKIRLELTQLDAS